MLTQKAKTIVAVAHYDCLARYTSYLFSRKEFDALFTSSFKITELEGEMHMKDIPLSTLLSYTNPKVLDRYYKDYPDNQLSAAEAFQDLMRYLWLSGKLKREASEAQDGKKPDFFAYIFPVMKEMDDMWHTFLLFTRDYREFCHQHFDAFLDHSPVVDGDPPRSIEAIEGWLSYIGKHLGEDTLRKWFSPLLKKE
jgi:hypothetical protein